MPFVVDDIGIAFAAADPVGVRTETTRHHVVARTTDEDIHTLGADEGIVAVTAIDEGAVANVHDAGAVAERRCPPVMIIRLCGRQVDHVVTATCRNGPAKIDGALVAGLVDRIQDECLGRVVPHHMVQLHAMIEHAAGPRIRLGLGHRTVVSGFPAVRFLDHSPGGAVGKRHREERRSGRIQDARDATVVGPLFVDAPWNANLLNIGVSDSAGVHQLDRAIVGIRLAAARVQCLVPQENVLRGQGAVDDARRVILPRRHPA